MKSSIKTVLDELVNRWIEKDIKLYVTHHGDAYTIYNGDYRLCRFSCNSKGFSCTHYENKTSKQVTYRTLSELVDAVVASIPKDRLIFRFYQPNPSEGLDCTKGDCAIRAVACALGIDWIAAFRRLCEYAEKNYSLPNNMSDTLTPFLEEEGYIFTGTKNRPTALEFAKTHDDGTYILYVQAGYSTHCLTLKDGLLYDAWCSIDKHLYGYFKLD